MKNLFKSKYQAVVLYIKNNKKKSILVLLIVVVLAYFGFNSLNNTSNQIKYVTTNVSKGIVISSVSGSGQVSATNKIDIKAKVSGDITWVGVSAGQSVYTGQALASIDSRDAKSAVADAEASLVQSKLQFQKDSASAPIDYQKALDSLDTAKIDLDTTFNDTFNTLSNTYLDLPTVVTGTQNILYGYDLNTNGGQWNSDFLNSLFSNKEPEGSKITSFADKAKSDYKDARTKYDASILLYKQISRSSPDSDIETVLNGTIDTVTSIAQSIQSELNFLSLVSDTAQVYNVKLPSSVSTMQTNARSYLSTVNSDLSSLLSQKKSIDNGRKTIKTYEQNIDLLKVGNTDGSNPISLQISQNNLVKQERNLEDLKSALNNYTVVAPFSGTLSSVSAVVGDSAGTIATIITKQQVAELSLNEVDAAKVNPGQKAVLTFDAISDLSITGTVAEVDSVGTVSQGVVSYTVKITFDVQDTRIKPGMTVNASIQTAVRNDVLYVPSSAVKTTNGKSIVQVFDPALPETSGTSGSVSATLPKQVEVVTGISSDSNVEIISGLTEGEQVVSRTITSTTKTSTASTGSLLGGSGAKAAGRIGG